MARVLHLVLLVRLYHENIIPTKMGLLADKFDQSISNDDIDYFPERMCVE
jgi:hypothetical protein